MEAGARRRDSAGQATGPERVRVIRTPAPFVAADELPGADRNPAKARAGQARLSLGTVIFAAVPFWDGTMGTKKRPAVVVRVDGQTVVVCPITSNSGRYRKVGAYPRLVFWQAAGLAKPSFLVPYLVRVDRKSVLNVTGSLHEADLLMVRQQNLPPALPPGSWDRGRAER